MDVPARQEDFLVIEREMGQALQIVFRVVQCEGRCELPVEEVSRQGYALVALEVGPVVLCQFLHRDVDGGLVSSRLAEMVFCRRMSNGAYRKGTETYQVLLSPSQQRHHNSSPWAPFRRRCGPAFDPDEGAIDSYHASDSPKRLR